MRDSDWLEMLADTLKMSSWMYLVVHTLDLLIGGCELLVGCSVGILCAVSSCAISARVASSGGRTQKFPTNNLYL